MSLVAGMDWTVYKKSSREIRGVSLVAVSDANTLETTFQNTNRLLGLPADKIFHAYEDAPEIQLALLRAVMTANMTVRIGAIIYDSDDGILDNISRLSAVDFTHDIGIRLVREFLPFYPLNKLVPDRDLEGSKQETWFKKAIRSFCHTENLHSPEIQFCSAKENRPNSKLVQLADVIIYNLYRLRRGAVDVPELRSLLRAIEKHPNNIIINLADLER